MKVPANYTSIEAVRAICEPWILLWSGDEWGESMQDLHGAAKTCYGLDDEDCATLAEILVRNLEPMWEDQQHDFSGYGGYATRDDVDHAQNEARLARTYWFEGGNLGQPYEGTVAMINSLPGWLFGDD